MSRDILGEFGPNTSKPQAARATSGGCTSARDVMNYASPTGPKGIMESASPGLHGANAGNANKPTANDGCGGRPGLGGAVHPSGSQGRR